jgi:hypothetical protein
MTSKAYLLPETAIDFSSAGDVTFTPTSLAADSIRYSNQKNFGTTARAYAFNWRAHTKVGTGLVVGEAVDIYAKTSDGTDEDNDEGTSDATSTDTDKLKNLKYIGSITVDEAVTSTKHVGSGVVQLTHRYFQVVWHNNTTGALSATAGDHGFSLEPIAIQGQAT